MPKDIYNVQKEDFGKAVDSLARAFIHYPYPGGIIKDDERQQKALYIMFDHEIWRISEFSELAAESPECKGVAVWCSIGDINKGVDLGKQASALFSIMKLPEMITTLRRCLSIERQRKRLHLPPDTVYLYALGVAPECQDQGIGSFLIRKKLAETDKEGRIVYLETNSEHNVGYYESFGFSVVKRVDEERGKFTTWYMVRQPKPVSE